MSFVFSAVFISYEGKEENRYKPAIVADYAESRDNTTTTFLNSLFRILADNVRSVHAVVRA